MPQHTSSEVTVGYNTIRFKLLKRERLEPNWDNIFQKRGDNIQTDKGLYIITFLFLCFYQVAETQVEVGRTRTREHLFRVLTFASVSI